ncbi:MAG TPA: tetratricopeptide repeat protein [Gemmatimonadaceae bacterium]|nr:tetratricopeptide repeat protein [Gemmatimonadaceae bacterium]
MIRLQTLGTVDLRSDGREMSTVIAQPKRLALLAYLAAARPRGFHSRDTLLALFWPESDGERARNSLRQALHHLRRSLGEAAIPGRGDREVAVDPTLVECDAALFDQAIEAGRWRDALELYHGDFLPGLFVQDAPEAERWLEDARDHRRRDAVSAAWKLSEESERTGDLASAERWARLAAGLEPMDDASLRRLLAVLERVGDPAGALAAHDAFARRLREDFGIAPSAETARLVTELRARAVSSPPRGERPLAAASSAVAHDIGIPASGSPAGRSASHRSRRRVATLAAATIAVVASIGGLVRGRSGGRDIVPASIAVLPFVNMSADPANEFLSDGISEELLNLLAQLPGLHVAARTSSFTFKGKSLPVDSIGRALRVRHVLEGSVRESGGRVRITAQLIDAGTGYHLWSGSFDSRIADVVAVQDSIGRVIVELLRPRLPGGVAPARRESADPEAHLAVMKGWRAFRQNTREGYEAAAVHFQEAMRRDTSYGRAYGGLATVRLWQTNFRYLPQGAGYTEAESLAHRSLALDSTLTEAHAVLARIAEVRDRDDRAAEAHFARAIALNPSEARAHGRRGALLVRLGRPDEAIASARRAVELDPASPAVYADMASVYHALDRYADEVTQLRLALSLDPGHPILLGSLAMALVSLRRYDEAEAAITQARHRAPLDANLVARHAYLQAMLRRDAAARALLDTAATLGTSPVELATTYTQLGDHDRAIGLLERAVEEHDDGVVSILDTMIMHPLHSDPRMQRLVERVRLRQAASER